MTYNVIEISTHSQIECNTATLNERLFNALIGSYICLDTPLSADFPENAISKMIHALIESIANEKLKYLQVRMSHGNAGRAGHRGCNSTGDNWHKRRMKEGSQRGLVT